MIEYAFHPLCLAFPEMEPDAYARRLADYRKHPERADDTVVLIAPDEDDGGELKILDGRHHYLICKELGYECAFEKVTGDRDELADIAEARGINRRHQSETQIAAALIVLNEFRRGRPPKEPEPPSGKLCTGAQLALEPKKSKQKTQTEAAKDSGVSRRTINSASAAAKAEPALLDLMRDGKLDAKTAEKVAKLPAAERKKVVKAADPKKAAKEALAKKEPKPEPTDADCDPADADREDPGAAFVAAINRLCHTLDAAKKELLTLCSTAVYGAHIHRESVTTQIEAARKALWQSRPTEACNCVRAGKPSPGCKACFGTGVAPASRILKGAK